MLIVDSHLHLDGQDAGETVKFASSTGALLVACGIDERTSRELVRLAESSSGVVKAFVGVHPSEATKSGSLGWLLEAAREASGIGEIGLDPTYSPIGEGGPQMDTFGRQVEVADKLGKPVQVHSRKAEAKCLEILSGHKVRALMHWLESEEALPGVMDRGYYVSFGPALLFSKKLQRMAAKADPSLMLLESDSPVAYSHLGGVRGPMLIPSVAFKLAELRKERFAEALERCNQNAMSFLGEKG